MGKLLKRVSICLMAVVLIQTGVFLADGQQLKNSLVRFHVVANSDSREDQDVKLLVRDAVILSIQQDLTNVSDVEQAKEYLRQNLPKIESLANTILETAGFEDRAVVSLCKETFSLREYDTFTLPGGVYEALWIVIGEGQGQNWWCVAFPNLCVPAASGGFVEAAAKSGLSDRMTDTLLNDSAYEVRFFLLDLIGKAENYFFERQTRCENS